MSTGAIISAAGSNTTSFLTSTKSNPSTSKSSSDPCSHLRFSAPTSFHSLKSTHSKSSSSSRTAVFPVVKAMSAASTAAAGNFYANQQTFYDLLGIPESGSLTQIKQAYKQLVKKYHPDVCPPDRAEEYTKRFIQVQEAYETLSDPRSRALYDRDIAKCLDMAFSARKYKGRAERDHGWQDRWISQLDELKRRSSIGEDFGEESMSWGARMRRKRCYQTC